MPVLSFRPLTAPRTYPVLVLRFLGFLAATSASFELSESLNCFQDLPSASFKLFGSLNCFRTCPVPVLSFLGPLTAARTWHVQPRRLKSSKHRWELT